MSTSILYHGWGAKDYRYLDTDFSAGAIWFHVEKKPEKRVCPLCQGDDITLAGRVLPPPKVRALPIGRKPVWLVLHLHRIACEPCNVVVQEARVIAEPKKHYTRQLARYILDLSRTTTIADVAHHLGMSWDTVKEILKIDLETRAERITWRNLRYIAIDEIAVRKGHNYMTVVMDLETGRVLFVAESRSAESLAPFFKVLRRSRTKLQAVAMDMNEGYKRAVTLYYRHPCAIVYDRFHVMKLLNFEIDQIRREELRKPEMTQHKALIKGQRFLLLYGSENLKATQAQRLVELLELNENLCAVYILKEQLRLFWEMPSREAGEAFLDEWIQLATATGIHRLIKFAKTLDYRREGLVSYFDHPISTGPLEGVNNAIKVLKRKAYGYRDPEFFKLRILFIHECSIKFAAA